MSYTGVDGGASESTLPEDLTRELIPLLEAKDRHRLISSFLKDELELPGYEAMLATKIIVPSL